MGWRHPDPIIRTRERIHSRQEIKRQRLVERWLQNNRPHSQNDEKLGSRPIEANIRPGEILKSPELVIAQGEREAQTQRERMALNEFRSYYESNRLEYNRAFEIEREQGIDAETFCRRVYRGFIEVHQTELAARVIAATATDRFMRTANQVPNKPVEIRLPVIALARIGEIFRMPEMHYETSRALIGLLLSSADSPVVQSALTERASFNALVEASTSILVSSGSSIELANVEREVIALVETGKALEPIETTLSAIPRAEKKEFTQTVTTRVYEAIQADATPEAVQLLVTGYQVLIEAGQAERISRLSSADIAEIATSTTAIRVAMAEADPSSITQAVANLAMIDVTVARSVTRSAADEAGLKIVPVLVTARDSSTNFATTEILLSALLAVAKQPVDGRAKNVVRVSFGPAVESVSALPPIVSDPTISDTPSHRLTRKEREVIAEKRAILASAQQAVEVAVSAGNLLQALSAVRQAAAIAGEQGRELPLDPLTIGYLYAGALTILNQELLRIDSRSGQSAGRAEEPWSSSNLRMVMEILESMMNPSLARGVRSISVASSAAQFFLNGIVMQKVRADRKAAEKIIAFLLKHKKTISRLLGMIEVKNIEEVVGFFDALILEANQIAGMISDPSRPICMVKDPFSPEILEQALQNVERPKFFVVSA